MLRPGRDKGIANPLPMGLAAFGTTTFLMGVAMVFRPAGVAPYVAQALMFGGLIEILAGMWGFAYGDPHAATAFTFIGAFYGWWGLSQTALFGAPLHGPAIASTGMVFVVTGAVVFYLWVASFYQFAAFNLTMLFFWIALILGAVFRFTGVPVIEIIAGAAAIISGLIAAYASFADLYNTASLTEFVPVGEFEQVRERAEREELERIRRIHPVNQHYEQSTPRQG